VDGAVLANVEDSDPHRLRAALERRLVLEQIELPLIPQTGPVPQDRRPRIAIGIAYRAIGRVVQAFLLCFSKIADRRSWSERPR
jgi:hypothetical protein